jgi:hypothetical protein
MAKLKLGPITDDNPDKLSAAMEIAERVYSLAQEQNDAALMI